MSNDRRQCAYNEIDHQQFRYFMGFNLAKLVPTWDKGIEATTIGEPT